MVTDEYWKNERHEEIANSMTSQDAIEFLNSAPKTFSEYLQWRQDNADKIAIAVFKRRYEDQGELIKKSMAQMMFNI